MKCLGLQEPGPLQAFVVCCCWEWNSWFWWAKNVSSVCWSWRFDWFIMILVTLRGQNSMEERDLSNKSNTTVRSFRSTISRTSSRWVLSFRFRLLEYAVNVAVDKFALYPPPLQNKYPTSRFYLPNVTASSFPFGILSIFSPGNTLQMPRCITSTCASIVLQQRG